jgi:type I restriction enzyme R subunit
MRQAIEEGFILDVLKNYTTFRVYFNLLKKAEKDPSYEKAKAIALLKSYADLHEHGIARKTQQIADHFHEQVRERIGGQAKAMVVTRSRLHAVRFKQAFDRYLKQQGHPYKALVAFSGTVRDPDTSLEYTEAQMNGLPEAQTAQTFKRSDYRFLIVANKFQTGFDQPLLHTMYVDKKLGGVNAVQTLSRLNRTHPGKEETFVLDFANDPEEIQKSFQPYYAPDRGHGPQQALRPEEDAGGVRDLRDPGRRSVLVGLLLGEGQAGTASPRTGPRGGGIPGAGGGREDCLQEAPGRLREDLRLPLPNPDLHRR